MNSNESDSRKKSVKPVLIIYLFGTAVIIVVAIMLFLFNIPGTGNNAVHIDKSNFSTHKSATSGNSGGSKMFSGKKIVGKKIKKEDIREFFFTYDSSTNPPYFQRYRLYKENADYFFYHEKREGDHWPLTQKDISVSGTRKLTDEEFLKFYILIEGGTVEKRKEHLESGGSGPWLFLYWDGDRDVYQEYTFESYDRRNKFQKLCEEYAAATEETAAGKD
jgi:hypothetical protein